MSGGNHSGSGIRPVNKPPSTPHGGFIVHRRLESSGRISTPPARPVYEHANRQDALDEADRLAVTYGGEFCVFGEIYTAYPPASVSQVEPVIDTPVAPANVEAPAAPAPKERPVIVEVRRRIRKPATIRTGK